MLTTLEREAMGDDFKAKFSGQKHIAATLEMFPCNFTYELPPPPGDPDEPEGFAPSFAQGGGTGTGWTIGDLYSYFQEAISRGATLAECDASCEYYRNYSFGWLLLWVALFSVLDIFDSGALDWFMNQPVSYIS